MTYRSTFLRLANDHCPRALDFAEAHAPYDRSIFHVGNAGHHVLHAVGEATNRAGHPLDDHSCDVLARRVGEELIAHGRAFDGRPEPPLPPDAVWAGRDLALSYLRTHPLLPGGEYEVGYAVDERGQPVAYDSPNARLRGILDRVEVRDESDEEPGPLVITHTDYKTDWPAGPDLLDSGQMKIQTLLLAASPAAQDADLIVRRIVNLRTGGQWEASVEVHSDEGEATLAGWRADIEATCDALDQKDAQGRRPAAPGIGCCGCPYVLQCEAATFEVNEGGAQRAAEIYVIASSIRDATAKLLRAELRDCAPIAINGGEVGYIAKTRRKLVDGAVESLLDRWALEFGAGHTAGLLNAMKLGSTHAENALKAMQVPGARGNVEERAQIMGELCEDTQVAEFGWRKQ